jgi:type I restriction-modification system DNA methylase subunit
MKIIKTGIFSLYERFPDQKKEIRTLHEKSETFKSLCEDHLKCCAAIWFWEHKEGDVAIQRRQEYEALIRDLEEEISEFLNGSP